MEKARKELGKELGNGEQLPNVGNSIQSLSGKGGF